jgi:nitrogen regulation protein NR(I)
MFDVGRSMLTVRRRRIRCSLVFFTIKLTFFGQQRKLHETAPIRNGEPGTQNLSKVYAMTDKDKIHILVVDDEEMIRFAFEEFIKDEGYAALLAGDAEAALKQIKSHCPAIVFLDYRLPDRDGLDLLAEIRKIDPDTAVVLMTAFGAMDVAIKAMQLGAYEYLTKPLDLEKVQTLIQRIFAGKNISAVPPAEEDERQPDAAIDQIIGKGPAMQEVFKMIGLLTTQEVTVLITGESGVGKELVARAIHDNSPRRNNPFVAVNCGAMPENLIEAEMFGYEQGAFTGAENRKPGKFEMAAGGTIFLDEIGELQLGLQVKLLRVLQERSFERVGGTQPVQTDARIIAATNKDLPEAVRQGRFRKDLFYRIYLINIHLPPLRERREDIPLLVDHFIRKINLDMQREVKCVTENALKSLVEYPWPGNVRELENQIHRAMVVSRENILAEHLFEIEPHRATEEDGSANGRLKQAACEYFADLARTSDSSGSIFEKVVAAAEAAVIREALDRTGGNQLRAAQLLGMHRSTLRKKLKNYGI